MAATPRTPHHPNYGTYHLFLRRRAASVRWRWRLACGVTPSLRTFTLAPLPPSRVAGCSLPGCIRPCGRKGTAGGLQLHCFVGRLHAATDSRACLRDAWRIQTSRGCELSRRKLTSLCAAAMTLADGIIVWRRICAGVTPVCAAGATLRCLCARAHLPTIAHTPSPGLYLTGTNLLWAGFAERWRAERRGRGADGACVGVSVGHGRSHDGSHVPAPPTHHCTATGTLYGLLLAIRCLLLSPAMP